MDEAVVRASWATEVMVIVPARNEEDALPACLESLVGQSEGGFALGMEWRLVVVDDGSTDGTRGIAEEFAAGRAGFEVLAAPVIDLTRAHSGFNGKTNACWAAAQLAIERYQPKWLLFTDADTVHGANSISRSLREAEKHEAAMLSYSPRQITTGFWQGVTMPLIFSELASVYPPALVSEKGESAGGGEWAVFAGRAGGLYGDWGASCGGCGDPGGCGAGAEFEAVGESAAVSVCAGDGGGRGCIGRFRR